MTNELRNKILLNYIAGYQSSASKDRSLIDFSIFLMSFGFLIKYSNYYFIIPIFFDLLTSYLSIMSSSKEAKSCVMAILENDIYEPKDSFKLNYFNIATMIAFAMGLVSLFI